MEIGSFEIDNACCVDEAFQKLKTGLYDVVVSDYEMPQKDGLQFLKKLREQNNKIPFILFTGKGREEVAIQALNLGAEGYLNKHGSPETVYGELSHSIKLVVERNKVKEALKERDIRFIKLAAQTPGMLFQFLRRPDGTFCIPFTSDGIREIFGCSPQDVQEDFSPIAKAIVPEDMEKVIQSIEHSAANLSLWQCEYRVQLPGKKIRWMWGQSAPEKLADGSILWSGFNTDITERKNAEEKLRGTFEALERVGEGIDAGLAIIGKDYRVVWANKRLMDLGVTPNRKCYQTFNRSEQICPDCGVKKVFEQNLPLDVHEFRTVNSKGETIWIEIRVTPLKDKEGNVTAALELAVPINERKKQEESLRKETQRLQNVIEGTSVGIWEWNVQTGEAEVNERWAEMVGYTRKELAPITINTLGKLAHPDDLIKLNELAQLHFEGKTSYYSFDFRIKHKNGSWIWVYDQGKVVEWTPDGKPLKMFGTHTDITERKKAENELGESEVKFKELTSLLPEMVFEIDTKGNIHFANLQAFEITGYSKEDFEEGFNAMRLVAPEDLERAKENMQNMFTKEIRHSDEYLWVRKDGSLFPVSLSSSPIFNDGKIVGARAIMIDITESKKAEEKMKDISRHDELVNEKLRVVGSLTRHDVGNKLMAAKSNLYLLKKRIGDNPDLAKYLDIIDSALASSDEIFEFSRLYEHIGVEKPSKENVFENFNQAVALMPNLGNIEVVNECKGLMVVADSLLKQLFYNFIDNSLKHGEKVTKIQLHYNREDDGGAILVYEDNGVGISEANKLKLFDKGFSTGKGSGLGLYLVKKMMNVYGWTITEDGKPDKGAKFVITIPNHNKDEKENYRIVP
jgi:PAS domain S-box-containing protein